MEIKAQNLQKKKKKNLLINNEPNVVCVYISSKRNYICW